MLKREIRSHFLPSLLRGLPLMLICSCSNTQKPQSPHVSIAEPVLNKEKLVQKPQPVRRLSGAGEAWVRKNRIKIPKNCQPQPEAEAIVNLACGLWLSQNASMSFGSRERPVLHAAKCFHLAMVRLSEQDGVGSDLERINELDAHSSHEPEIAPQERRYDIARFEWVRSQLALGKAEASLQSLEFFSKIYPQEPEVWGGLGVALLGLGRLNNALTPLMNAVKLEPERASRWDNLGTAQFLAGDMRQAVASYRGALSRDSLSPQIRADLGAALLISGEVDEGIAHLREAVRREPKNGLYLSNLAYALYIDEQLSEASELIRQATKLAPRDVSTWLNQVTISAANGDLDTAQESLLEAEKLGSQDPRVTKARSDLDLVLQLRK